MPHTSPCLYEIAGFSTGPKGPSAQQTRYLLRTIITIPRASTLYTPYLGTLDPSSGLFQLCLDGLRDDTSLVLIDRGEDVVVIVPRLRLGGP